MTIALIVGHNARAQGAVRTTDGRTEYDWCGDLAGAIRDCAPGMYTILRRSPRASYIAEINEVYAVATGLGVRATVELHFNGGLVGATGTETLSSGSAGSRRLAALMQAGICGALGLRDRGILIRARSERGGESLHASKTVPAVMLEPYFGSNPQDCRAADRHYAALVQAIHRACVDWARS